GSDWIRGRHANLDESVHGTGRVGAWDLDSGSSQIRDDLGRWNPRDRYDPGLRDVTRKQLELGVDCRELPVRAVDVPACGHADARRREERKRIVVAFPCHWL